MKTVAYCLFIVGATTWPGCATRNQDPSDGKAQIFYFDRNGDGKVDQEKHKYRGVADADWELRDEDYDGRYEKKILYGFGIVESTVDLPAPTRVPTAANP
jgi:hypothetical protein